MALYKTGNDLVINTIQASLNDQQEQKMHEAGNAYHCTSAKKCTLASFRSEEHEYKNDFCQNCLPGYAKNVMDNKCYHKSEKNLLNVLTKEKLMNTLENQPGDLISTQKETEETEIIGKKKKKKGKNKIIFRKSKI